MEEKNKNKLIQNILLLLIFICLLCNIFIISSNKYNNKTNNYQLNVVTKLGNNQGYHPKVISFDKKWNGYKYWMAFTPYPKGDSSKENPIINVSNDLINWVEPKGIKNPLDVPSNADSKHYNSDTHLLFNSDTKELELFFRYVDDENNKVIIYKMTSKDGSIWNEKELFLESDNRKVLDYVSPAIIYENGIYKVWFVNDKKVKYIEKNGNSLSDIRIVDIPYNGGLKTWHLDVIYNFKKKIYEIVTCAYYDINYRAEMNLYYSYSKDNITWSKAITILKPSNSHMFDSQGLYRSSLLFDDNYYYLFYSGHDKNMNVGIGLVKGNNIQNLV